MAHNIIEIGGVDYQEEKPSTDASCVGCEFDHVEYKKGCSLVKCSPIQRKDKLHVIYKIVVKEN